MEGEKKGAPVVKQSSLEMDLKKEELVQFQRSFNVSWVHSSVCVCVCVCDSE